MLSIMVADIRNRRRPRCQLLLVGGFDKFLQIRHQLVELPDRVVPLFGVKFHKGLIVVTAEFFQRLSFELDQVAAIPKQQMISQLTDRVPPAGGCQLACSAVSPSTPTVIGTNQTA
jgi:hypothetical protein